MNISVLKDLGSILTVLGAFAAAGWSAYHWIDRQTQADEYVATEVAPAIKDQGRTLIAVRKTLDLLAEDKLATQIAMESKCEEPGNDMPKAYCEDVLLKKRLRLAREEARASEDAR